MFEALVITLREGVEAALVLAIALAVLRRGGRDHLRAPLLAGAAAALVVSAVVAGYATRITYNQELAEGVAMLVGAILVAGLVWWMWKTGPHMKREVEAGIAKAASGGQGGSFGVFLFAFGMVFREGLETAIFLSAAGFTSAGLGLWLGAFAGLGLAIVFGVLFVHGSVRIPLRPFFSVTTAVLILIAVQLVIGGLHELSEAQVLPSSKAEMALVGPIVKNELLLFALTVALAAGWLLLGNGRRAELAAAESTGAEARLRRAAHARDARLRRWSGAVGLAVVGLLTTASVQQSRVPALAPAAPLALARGTVRIPAAPLADGRMHFYSVPLPEGTVRFFAVQVGDQ
ncbi:MAG TPA: FTR1 family protein, partial [Candidatus Limnocylindria bacterium]|nr:FTR1 family protein [Candidatus Limnocylindria bacterium]